MNTQALNMAKTLYQRGDWAGAANALSQVKAAGEVCGEADHLRGNAFMKLGMFNEAAGAYAEALAALAALREPIDRFFTDVLVMDDDPKVRDNRLRLLNRFASVFGDVADIGALARKK